MTEPGLRICLRTLSDVLHNDECFSVRLFSHNLLHAGINPLSTYDYLPELRFDDEVRFSFNEVCSDWRRSATTKDPWE